MCSRFTIGAAVVAFALGLAVGWAVFAAAGRPCWEVQADLEGAADEQLASPGQDGDDRMREAAALAVERPDCFPPRERELLERIAEAPSDAPPREGTTTAVPTEEPTELGTTAG